MKSVSVPLAALAVTALSASAAVCADDAVMRRIDKMQAVIRAQQKEIAEHRKEIEALSRDLSARPAPALPAVAASLSAPPAEARLAQQEKKVDALVATFAAMRDERRLMKAEPAAGIADGRPIVTSADGRFTAAIRVAVQYDAGYFQQSARARTLPSGPDLSSGGNFRRAQLGLQGKVFGDWSYYFRMDFGGGGSETPGHIQQAYIEYGGLAPFAFRIGAHSASTGLDDSDPSTDLPLLERSAAADLARGMAGGTRNAVEALYQTDRLFGSLALTGDKPQATGLFDEQQAVVGRFAYSIIADGSHRWVMSAAAADIFKVAGSGPRPDAPRPLNFKSLPEITIDDNASGLIGVSDADVAGAWNWNLESGATWRNLMAEGGYFGFGVDLRGPAMRQEQHFHGWYLEGSWVLTGEARGWAINNGGFSNPKPDANFDPKAGHWGALELAGRFSDLNLNDHAGTLGAVLPPGGVRGGVQHVVSLGLNWYPNPALKFQLQAQNVQVSRIGTNTLALPNLANASLGQNFDTLALRSQFAF